MANIQVLRGIDPSVATARQRSSGEACPHGRGLREPCDVFPKMLKSGGGHDILQVTGSSKARCQSAYPAISWFSG